MTLVIAGRYRLGAIAIGLLSIGEPSHDDGNAGQCESDWSTPPASMFQLPPRHLLDNGSLIVTDGGWLLAGELVDVDEESTTIITHSVLGGLALPSAVSAIRAPWLAQLGTERVGLLWASAVAPEGFAGPDAWPSYTYTELWFAEWLGSRWSDPQKVLESDLRVDWPVAATVRHSEKWGAIAMVSRSGFRDASVHFGQPPGGLTPIPVGPGLRPVDGSFYEIEGSGAIRAVVRAVPDPSATTESILIVESTDGGETWSAPEVVWRSPASTGRRPGIRFEVDALGNEHILWSPVQAPIVEHIVRIAGRRDWLRQEVPAQASPFLGMEVGVSGCGLLTLVLPRITAASALVTEVLQWRPESGWQVDDDALAGWVAARPFTGSDHFGRWYVAWSGLRADSPTGTPLAVWTIAP